MSEAATGDVLQEGVFLEILQNLHLCQSLFFNKVAGQPFLQNTFGWLLLKCLIRKQANENDEQSYFSKKVIVWCFNISSKMINFFICFHTQWKFFIQIKFHPGMKFYSFHPGMKLTCKQIFFHHGTSFILGWEFVSVTCKRTLNGLNDKTHRTVIGNEYLMFAFGSKSIALR